MRVPLPLSEVPRWPAGITVRSFVPGRDDDELAPGEQPGVRRPPGPGRLERGDAAAPDRRAVVRPGGVPPRRVAPTVWPGSAGPRSTRTAPDGRLGEIYVIGVDPDHQGTGLGRALTVGGLEHLAPRPGLPDRDALRRRRPTRLRSASTGRSGSPCTGPTASYAVGPRRDAPVTGRPRDELDDWLAAAGDPRYRVDQVVDALYRQRVPLEDATALPRALAHRRSTTAFPLALDPVVESDGDDGDDARSGSGACASDGVQIETVLMRYPTARDGLRLQPGRLRDGVHVLRDRPGRVRAPPRPGRDRRAGRACGARVRRSRSRNVVFMGMGEPLANYDATWAAVERLHGDLGISARHITISTVGHRARHPAPRDRGAPGDARDLAARARRRRCATR